LNVVGALFGLAISLGVLLGIFWGGYLLTARFLSPWPLTRFVRRFTMVAGSLLATRTPLADGLERADVARWGSRGYYRVREIATELRHGASLSEALRGARRAFGDYYVEMVEIGERSGTLAETFERFRRQGTRSHDEVVRLCGQVAYPLMVSLSLAGLLIIVFMMRKVIPQFQEMFADFDIELPWITERLIAVSGWFAHYWPVFVLCLTAAMLWGALARLTRGIDGRGAVVAALHDGLLLSIPGVRRLARDLSVGRAALAVGELTGHGMDLSDALEKAGRMRLNYWVARRLAGASREMKAGAPADEALEWVEPQGWARRLLFIKGHPSFMEPMLVAHTRYGLQTGDMSGAMHRLSQICFDRFYLRLNMLVDAVAPAWTLVNGLAVGFVCLGLFMPLVTLMNTMGG